MIGELTDKGLSVEGYWVARIDDVPYPCLPTTITFLERLEKGWQVEYHLNKENKISKISRAPKTAPADGGFTTADKLKKAGFDQPAKPDKQPEKETMSQSEVDTLKARADAAAKEKAHAEEMAKISKDAKEYQDKMKAEKADKTPLESGIKLVQGQITALDVAAHTVTVKDIKGVHHEMVWKAALNDKMSKLKQWWFCAISAEKSGEYWIVIDQQYYAKPPEWPVSQKPGYGGGKAYTPKNEKPIAYESAFKSCVDLVRDTDFPGLSYAERVEAVRVEAEKIAKWIVTEGGA